MGAVVNNENTEFWDTLGRVEDTILSHCKTIGDAINFGTPSKSDGAYLEVSECNTLLNLLKDSSMLYFNIVGLDGIKLKLRQ